MSAGGSGAPAEGAVDANMMLAIGIIGGLVGIYVSGINPIIGPVISCLGAVCAILWGVVAIRSVASYGLGTGVPSIGYMSLGIGVIGALAGVGIIATFNLSGLAIAGPILALVFAMIIGLLVAIVAKKIVGMKIPVMERCTAEIAGAAALAVLGFSSAVAGGYAIDNILTAVVAPGFIALFYILVTMAIQHPFNACLGPNEDQVRTLKCGASTAFLTMIITGIIAISADLLAGFVVIIVGLIGWYISFKMFVDASCEAAASVKWAGLWPKVEE
ncbi:tetrahydromethanopterin S-methyltransferase subunit MtrC [uncultured Methanobrevibacter sp.]|uniref:tetrahydromethanopterin S-methyltransferase subunit MtrC n=1 Tax=uncultured Methanobrevibacter sp. TaxID=253161 RepID=UPI00261C632A